MTKEYNISFYDIHEVPPKVSVKISSVSNSVNVANTANSFDLVNKIDIELMIIPGVCFDTFNNRIGFGKGYYDRYLHDCESIYKLGICFNEQIICEEIQVDEFDIKMNQIISD